MFWRKKKPAETQPAPEPRTIFSTHLSSLGDEPMHKPAMVRQRVGTVGTMDSSAKLTDDAMHVAGVPDAQFGWYAGQSFIGYQAAAIIAQNWLVDKACLMPARDAIRHGYEVNGPDAAVEYLKEADKRYRIDAAMRELVHMGRIFGIRIAIFRVDSADPEYYEKPFNIDGVAPGSYRGISQVDPIWVSPILTDTSLSDPASIRFYEPQFWMVNGQKYHRSHLHVYIPHPVADTLKPMYQYGGIPLPQLIYERVYAAERTANEAPQLAMTKRLSVLKVNALAFFSNLGKARENLAAWVSMRDNYGVKVVDKESEDLTQFDTGLADLDVTIMTQYQLVAAIAGVPSTKLLGTTPKGFNSTGEYEAEDYRQTLESIQSNDLTPLLEKHHAIALRSAGMDAETTVDWRPLDSPTAAEWAAISLQKAQAAQIYAGIGAVDGYDVRDMLKADKMSDYYQLAEIDETDDPTQTPAPDQQA